MSQLRTTLEQYVADINEILQTCKDDQSIREEALKRWVPTDPRFLVFTEEPSPNMPISPPDSTGGDTTLLPNEMPPSPPSHFVNKENQEKSKPEKKKSV